MTAVKGPLLLCALVVVSILLCYTAYDKKEKTLVFGKLADVLLFKEPTNTVKEFNKVAGLSGIGLLSICMILGPLSVFFPRIFTQYLSWRRFLGVAGVAIIIAHALYSFIVYYGFSTWKMFFEHPPQYMATAPALLALIIFLAMAATSNAKSATALGPKRWKALHRIGYIALALATMHFIIIETKPEVGLDVRPYALLFIALPVLTLILKVASMIKKG